MCLLKFPVSKYSKSDESFDFRLFLGFSLINEDYYFRDAAS